MAACAGILSVTLVWADGDVWAGIGLYVEAGVGWTGGGGKGEDQSEAGGKACGLAGGGGDGSRDDAGCEEGWEDDGGNHGAGEHDYEGVLQRRRSHTASV